MPMPPPKPTTESRRDRHVGHEIVQEEDADQDSDPQTSEALPRLVGAPYTHDGSAEQAIGYAVSDGLVLQTNDGRYEAT